MDEHNLSLLCVCTIGSPSQCDICAEWYLLHLGTLPCFEHVGFSSWNKLTVVLYYAQNVHLHTWLTCFSSNVTYNRVHVCVVFLSVTEDSEKRAIET
jgi:hypothetical protein